MPSYGKNILIVDDNPKNLEIVAKILKDKGYLISLFLDGKTAVEYLENNIPDLILLDIMMPEMDGLELCRIIKNEPGLCEIPVIFLTAKNQTEEMAEGFKAGGVDYIIKPFKAEELLIRVKNHLELSLSRKKIIEMNKTRDKLYSIIAHDIRSPFSGIRMTINAIADGYLEPGSSEYVEIMNHLVKSTSETSMLLDNLLSWTKLHSDSVIVYPRLNHIFPVINDSVQLLKPAADNKKISLNVDVADNLTAFFDEATMTAVFRNIINNSVKFTQENGLIKISADKIPGYIRVIVKDNGVGISDEIMKKVFIDKDHFSSRGTNKEQGSGLGMFLIRDFTEKNNGKLEVKSKPGEGSELSVCLPLDNFK